MFTSEVMLFVSIFLSSASIEEAIDAEKYFVDYFSTTEAEAVAADVVEIQPPKSKYVKRTKKAPVKVVERDESSSESDAECPGETIFSFLLFSLTFLRFLYNCVCN